LKLLNQHVNAHVLIPFVRVSVSVSGLCNTEEQRGKKKHGAFRYRSIWNTGDTGGCLIVLVHLICKGETGGSCLCARPVLTQHLRNEPGEGGRFALHRHLQEPRFAHIIPDPVLGWARLVRKGKKKKRAWKSNPSGSKTTTLDPTVFATRLPSSSVLSHFSAPLKALPLLPPTRRPSDLMSLRTASNASLSSVFIQQSTSGGSRART